MTPNKAKKMLEKLHAEIKNIAWKNEYRVNSETVTEFLSLFPLVDCTCDECGREMEDAQEEDQDLTYFPDSKLMICGGDCERVVGIYRTCGICEDSLPAEMFLPGVYYGYDAIDSDSERLYPEAPPGLYWGDVLIREFKEKQFWDGYPVCYACLERELVLQANLSPDRVLSEHEMVWLWKQAGLYMLDIDLSGRFGKHQTVVKYQYTFKEALRMIFEILKKGGRK